MRLKVENATFSYKAGQPVFKDISLSIDQGEILCLLGPNGAGKSTLLNCIGNLNALDKGKITLDGEEISSMSRMNIAKKIGYIPQFHNPIFSYLVSEFVLMGRTPYIGPFSSPSKEDYEVTRKAIEVVGINNLASKHYNQISGGERQLVMFAKVLAQSPDIILLDEPTSHLDFGNQMKVLSLIESLANCGYSVIMTSHFPDHALLISAKVGLMKEHTFIDVGPADQIITEENMRRSFDMNVKIEFIEQANRKMVIPLKAASLISSFEFSKLKGYKSA